MLYFSVNNTLESVITLKLFDESASHFCFLSNTMLNQSFMALINNDKLSSLRKKSSVLSNVVHIPNLPKQCSDEFTDRVGLSLCQSQSSTSCVVLTPIKTKVLLTLKVGSLFFVYVYVCFCFLFLFLSSCLII